MNASTEFREPRAVEAWDACFRLRDGDHLIDVTVDATWRRVASTLTTDSTDGLQWRDRYIDAFRRWRVLPDERLLRHAGSGHLPPAGPPPAAVVNLAALLDRSASPPGIDLQAVRDAAALAVHMLDDAVVRYWPDARDLHVGWIGAADALSALGLAYHSEAARERMARVAASLANGCLDASVRLAEERGARTRADSSWLSRWQALGIDGQVIERACRSGLRYRDLTAIAPHPQLATLANAVADGLDPASGVRGHDTGNGWGQPRSSVPSAREALARSALRAAVQPWIDQRILH